MKLDFFRFLYVTVGLCAVSIVAGAQQSVTVDVSADDPFTDHVALSKDADLLVRFTFDEAANTLTAELKSYANIFVFADKARYGHLILFRKFKPKKLPFPAVTTPKSGFKVTSSFRKSIHGKKRSHVFRRWMECEGIEPQQREYGMVNDQILQTFSISGPEDTVVTLCLREVCVLQPRKKEGKYRMTSCTDLERKYQINIHRDWCFGHDEEVEAERAKFDNMRMAYDSLCLKFPGGVAPSQESVDLFEAIRSVVLQQNPRTSEESRCATIAQLRKQYNAYLDSLASMRVALPVDVVETIRGINVENMLRRTRTIDRSVSRWLVSRDVVERRDIEACCDSMIVEARREIRTHGIFGEEQRSACETFDRAVRYYVKTCEK